MIEKNYARCVINDILSSEEYSLMGLATYTQSPEDVIFDIAAGINTDPGITLFRKIIELHRAIRPDLYEHIMEKIIKQHSND